ncbi:WGR domain protein [Magnetococcus marinus MC-1]|uniref:WGR domain protein n=1 Tax=Magnetococcus marinus (strain ATCC BAA-1437 / JCM 17883 / MC-1) TaxID=156889 RepID=A0LE00_MAGMM|nr:WGR domain-containing protein [Magnetococcus marinus]ABK46193.1 WGR domain protein [Magnetococcus marinus MC-1]
MKAYLQQINRETGMVWYYAIQIQPDLLGRWHVIREWGKSGSPGTMRRNPFETHQEAVAFLIRLRDSLTKRGYRLVMQEGLSGPIIERIKAEHSHDGDS